MFSSPMVIRLLITLLLTLCLSSCALFLKKPKVDDVKVTATGLSFSHLHLKVFLKVNNPNSKTVSVDRIRYSARLESLIVAEDALAKTYNLKPEQVTEVIIPIKLRLKVLSESLRSIIENGHLNYEVKGSLRADRNLTLPFEKSGQTNLPALGF